MTIRQLTLLLLTSLIACGATYNAATCAESDVQSAYTTEQASKADGDIIAIPSCSSTTWTSQWAISPTNAITFQGNTTVSCTNHACTATDATTITDNASTSGGPMWGITTATGKSFRLTGITFSGGGSTVCGGTVVVSGSSTSVRLDHNDWNLTSDCKQVQIAGCVYGVADHFVMNLTASTTNNGFFLNQNTCGGDSLGVGNGQWNEATSPGSATSFYFEDFTFNGGTNTGGSGSTVAPFANDCSGGGRFVFRFGTFKGIRIQGHATGHSDSPPDRGCRAMEIYKNAWSGTSVTNQNNPNESALFWTSGTGMIWGNTVTEDMKNFVESFVDRVSNATYAQSAPPNGWGYCGTAQTGSSSAWDQNTNSTGRACLDGVGRGKGDLLQGSFPNVCDASSTDCTNNIYTGRWPNQASEPIYEFLDSFSSAPTWGGVLWSDGDTATVQNEDFYLNSNGGSGANCSGFTGATGVGCGTLASKPSTCTTGVAWWATDQGSWNSSGSGGQGVLYECTATNTWTASYTPYTYPHPLDSNGAAAPTGGVGSSNGVTSGLGVRP